MWIHHTLKYTFSFVDGAFEAFFGLVLVWHTLFHNLTCLCLYLKYIYCSCIIELGLVFFRSNDISFSLSGCPILHSHKEWATVPTAVSSPVLFRVTTFIAATLRAGFLYLRVDFICIAFWWSDVPQLFNCFSWCNVCWSFSSIFPLGLPSPPLRAIRRFSLFYVLVLCDKWDLQYFPPKL